MPIASLFCHWIAIQFVFTSAVSHSTGVCLVLSRESCGADRRTVPEQAAEVALLSRCGTTAEQGQQELSRRKVHQEERRDGSSFPDS